MIRWICQKWKSLFQTPEPESLVSFRRKWEPSNMHGFMQRYPQIPFGNPVPGDHVWFVYNGRILGGVLLGYVSGGCEVEVMHMGVVFVDKSSTSYDQVFEELLWEQHVPGTRKTKAPHLRLITLEED